MRTGNRANPETALGEVFHQRKSLEPDLEILGADHLAGDADIGQTDVLAERKRRRLPAREQPLIRRKALCRPVRPPLLDRLGVGAECLDEVLAHARHRERMRVRNRHQCQRARIGSLLDIFKPSPRLLPEDTKERAYARSLALMTIADAHPLTVPRVRKHLTKAFGADAHAVEEWGAHWTTEALATYERLLARRRPSPFALGKEIGLADICIAGQVVGSQYLKVNLDSYPLVKDLSERCFRMVEFSSSHPYQQPDYKASGP